MFHAPRLLSYLNLALNNPQMHLHMDPKVLNFWNFMTWFQPTEQWLHELRTHYGKYVLITFHKPMLLLPQEPDQPPEDEPLYNNAEF